MSAQDDAFKEGMRMRRDNVTESELNFIVGKGYELVVKNQTPSQREENESVVEGWKFMDRLILGLDMLEGRA